MDTYTPKNKEIQRSWYLINGKNFILGRLSSLVAFLLRGKEKVIFTPNINFNNIVIIVNADKVMLTGRKLKEKLIYHYSGYPGGLKIRKYGDFLLKDSSRLIQKSVKGMLPKNKLSFRQIKNLKVFNSDTQHPYKNIKDIKEVHVVHKKIIFSNKNK